jgi:hypothetical protein
MLGVNWRVSFETGAEIIVTHRGLHYPAGKAAALNIKAWDA